MPTTSDTLAAPEVGQLVRVRDRHWVVTNVVASSLETTGATPSHLVELSSVEDDAYGDELTVFGEVEPGTVVLPRATLPQPSEAFDDPGRLSAFLDAVRWGAIASADARALQSAFRSGISIDDYQLDPVLRALQMPRVNLLIADDVGLGKTIEAGLVRSDLIGSSAGRWQRAISKNQQADDKLRRQCSCGYGTLASGTFAASVSSTGPCPTRVCSA